MKKIIAAFDALRLSQSTKEHALYLAREIPANITGVFVEDVPLNQTDSPLRTVGETKKINAGHRKDRKDVIKAFETSCRNAQINCTICKDNHMPTQELLNESIYADVMVINVNETFTEYPQTPSRLIRQLLAETQCPVLIVPDDYKPIRKIILLYDGSPSSVYAIKIFSNLFENRTQHDVEVVTAKTADGILQPNSKLMKEFLNRHYPSATYTVLRGDAEDTIPDYISRQADNALVVMGGYQKSSMVRSFKATLMDALMRKLKFPLFIAFTK